MVYTGKYAKYFTTDIKEDSLLPDVIPGPTFGLRGARIIPEAKANFGWNVITKPYFLDRVTHVHPGDGSADMMKQRSTLESRSDRRFFGKSRIDEYYRFANAFNV